MKHIGCLAVLVMLTACGGGQNGSVPAAPAHRNPAAYDVAIKIDVPKSSAARKSQYVSPATTQMTIDVQQAGVSVNGYPQTIALTPTSGGCSSTLATTYCQLTLALAPGKYTVTMTAKDAGGNALSAAQSIPFTVVAASSNTVSVTLGGIPTSIALIPNASSTLSGNSATGYTMPSCGLAQSVSVLTTDADGNYILGPGAPTVSLTSANTADLAVAAVGSTSPNAFSLTCPVIVPWSSTVQLTATATPAGGAPINANVGVTFYHAVAGTITEYTSGLSSPSAPDGITAGPDGALWFVEHAASKVGRITTAGAITEYGGMTANAQPYDIAAGPDGALWFTEPGVNKIGRITTAGAVTEFSLAAGSGPVGITAGPDGALWFTEDVANRIGRITTAGTITEYSGLTASAQPYTITTGPDGALWFTEPGVNQIGRISTAGTITEYGNGITGNCGAYTIAAGPDGALWFAEFNANKIGRITIGGTVSEFSSGMTANASPFGITAGPDGALWFSEFGTNMIGRITTAGAISELSNGITLNAEPYDITAGPDGAVWFTESTGRIGQVK